MKNSATIQNAITYLLLTTAAWANAAIGIEAQDFEFQELHNNCQNCIQLDAELAALVNNKPCARAAVAVAVKSALENARIDGTIPPSLFSIRDLTTYTKLGIFLVVQDSPSRHWCLGELNPIGNTCTASMTGPCSDQPLKPIM